MLLPSRRDDRVIICKDRLFLRMPEETVGVFTLRVARILHEEAFQSRPLSGPGATGAPSRLEERLLNPPKYPLAEVDRRVIVIVPGFDLEPETQIEQGDRIE